MCTSLDSTYCMSLQLQSAMARGSIAKPKCMGSAGDWNKCLQWVGGKVNVIYSLNIKNILTKVDC